MARKGERGKEKMGRREKEEVEDECCVAKDGPKMEAQGRHTRMVRVEKMGSGESKGSSRESTQ